MKGKALYQKRLKSLINQMPRIDLVLDHDSNNSIVNIKLKRGNWENVNTHTEELLLILRYNTVMTRSCKTVPRTIPHSLWIKWHVLAS